MTTTWSASVPIGKPKNTVIGIGGSSSSSSSGSVNIASHKVPESIEEHIAYFKKEIVWLKKEIKEVEVNMRNEIGVVRTDVSKKYAENIKSIKDLHNKLVSISVGGIKVQAFGVILLIYGAAISSFA